MLYETFHSLKLFAQLHPEKLETLTREEFALAQKGYERKEDAYERYHHSRTFRRTDRSMHIRGEASK